MPDRIPRANQRVELILTDADDPKKQRWSTVNQDGRFIVDYVMGRTCTILVYFDGMKDGKAVRFFGQSQKLQVKGTVGPITIKLDKIARQE